MEFRAFRVSRALPAIVRPSSCPSQITVKELADLLGVNPADIIRELIKSGIFANINQGIDRETASLVAEELGYEVAEQAPIGAATGRRRRGRSRQRRHQGQSSSRRTRPP